MSLFTAVGTAIRKILGKEQSIDKMELASRLEDLIAVSEFVQTAFSSKPTLDQIEAACKNSPSNVPLGATLLFLGKHYYADLLPRLRTDEARNGFLSSIGKAAGVANADLRDVLKNFDQFYGGRAVTTIKPSEMRISDITIQGFVERTSQFMRWASFVLNAGTANGDVNTAPRYQLDAIMVDMGASIKYINAILSRNVSLMGEISRIRQENRDVAVVTDGATFDQYATDREYSPSVVANAQGFIRSPVVTIGQYRIERERARAVENKHLQNWLRNKISLLRLQQAKVDPNSADYRRIQSYVDNYMKDLTIIDKELEHYASAV